MENGSTKRYMMAILTAVILPGQKLLQNGQFIQKEDKNGDYRVCTGNFQYQTDSLYINSNCISTMQVNFVSELTATTLIIDQPVDEGVIRLKYVAIK